MTSDDLNRFIQVDNFKCLIVEATNESSYGFNLSNDVEKAAAIQVVKDKDDFTVVGWSIGKTIPNWVKSFDEWNIYNSVYIQVKNAGAKNSVDHEHLSIDSGLSLQQDDEAAEKDIFDNVVSPEENENTNRKIIHNPYLKVQPEDISSYVKTKFDHNADLFDVCGDELKKEIKTNIFNANKSEPVKVDVCGPFMNSKSGKGSYIVIFGALKKGWTLRAPFLHGYVGTLVERMNSRKNTSINVEHCETYYEFNIKKVEFGNESLWLRLPPRNGGSGNTVKRLNFVLSFDVTESDRGLEMVKDALEFLAFTMKKREKGPVGGLLLDHLKYHAVGLYDFIIKRHPSLQSAEDSLTNDIDAQFLGGFTINTNRWLNRFMGDYDIIRVLKNHVGYKSWDDVPTIEREYCYKNYTSKTSLPMWNTIQEKY